MPDRPPTRAERRAAERAGTGEPGNKTNGQAIGRKARRLMEQEQQARKKRLLIRGGIGIAIVVIAAIIALFLLTPQSVQAGTPIDNIQCGSMEGQSEHIHSHLALFRDGKAVTLPAYIGILQLPSVQCLYWLHTHATTDVIHVEAPQSGTYTIGQFIDIWRKTTQWEKASPQSGPIVDSSFADALATAPSSQIHAFIGKKDVGSDYRSITLANHENITIELGSPLVPPVSTFDWKAWDKVGL